MPIHDWARVRPGIFHAFHQAWIYVLQDVLNDGILPPGFSALSEQVTGPGEPDLIVSSNRSENDGLEASVYAAKSSVLAIRHASSGDRVVATIEIVSPGNKASRHALRAFVEKTAITLHQGVHALVVDLHSPTARDPQGIHPIIWNELGGDPPPPPDKPLTLAAYRGTPALRAYVEPVAVGEVLKAMPLCLTIEDYVSVPLEETYARAFKSMPAKTRAILEGNGS